MWVAGGRQGKGDCGRGSTGILGVLYTGAGACAATEKSGVRFPSSPCFCVLSLPTQPTGSNTSSNCAKDSRPSSHVSSVPAAALSIGGPRAAPQARRPAEYDRGRVRGRAPLTPLCEVFFGGQAKCHQFCASFLGKPSILRVENARFLIIILSSTWFPSWGDFQNSSWNFA